MAKNKIKIPVVRRVSIDIEGKHPTAQEIELLLAIGQPSPKAEISHRAGVLSATWIEITKIKFKGDEESDEHSEPMHLEAETTFGFAGPYEGDVEVAS